MKPPAGLESFLDWLLNHSLQAGALVLIVLAAQRLFRRQLTHRWRFALWWIVLARLVLPFGPESALSVFNWVKPSSVLPKSQPTEVVQPAIIVSPAAQTENAGNTLSGVNDVSGWLSRPQFPGERSDSITESLSPGTAPTPGKVLSVADQPVTTPLSLVTILSLVWLGGVLALSLFVLVQVFRFQLRLRRATTPADATAAALLEQCRNESGVRRKLALLETDCIRSPALFGLFRLRLLLPKGLAAKFSTAELRYIYLHELAHVKRGDLWLNWLVTGLQVMHWFNPLIWFGFARLRADRELACDELTLLSAGEKVGTSYGETVIKLLEGVSRPAAIPGLVGILEDAQQMRRRIRMIASFRRPGRWSALAVLLLAFVAAVALTDAQTPRPAASSAKQTNSSTNSIPNIATTSNISIRLASTNAPHVVTLTDGNSTAVINLDYVSSEHQWTVDATNRLNELWRGYRSGTNGPAKDLPGNSVSTNANDFSSSNVIYLSHLDLRGAVRSKQDQPLAATVFIATAAPRTGTSTFCPSCYADCRKSSRADSEGKFTIEGLDPMLTFQILAVAKGYKPKYVAKVDPFKGPVQVVLEPIEAGDATPDRSVRGRVIDTKGKPIAGAVVEMEGITRKDGTGGWGSFPGIDPLAVADENGEFLITSKETFAKADLKVSARAFANKNFNQVSTGGKHHDLVLTEGATLTGRVLLNGKPAAGVSVGVSGTERGVEEYVGNFEVGTGTNGAFLFVNLPPNTDYCIYGIMNSMKTLGAIPVTTIHAGKDGEITRAGDLAILPGHRLAGRVILSDGAAIPANTRLLVSREQAWDSMQLTLNPDGTFDTPGIPTESISLSVRVKGYGLSARNASLDSMNPFQFVGRVERDVTSLKLLLEKGADPQPDYSFVRPEADRPANRPLRGTEGGVDHSHDWIVSGRVLDRATKQAIEKFRVVTGEGQQFGRVGWNKSQTVDGTNGSFLVYLSQRSSQPLIKVEADEYLPAAATLLPRDTADLEIYLTKGNGPSGNVIAPDGTPAAGASVVLICDGNDQVNFNDRRQLDTYWNHSLTHKAEADGGFAFKAEWGMKAVAAASSNGFAVVSIESLNENPALKLGAYGRVTGTLMRPSGPVTNEDLDLSFADISTRGLPAINLYCHATTDANGRFSFDRVPPGELKLTSRLYMEGGMRHSWQSMTLRDLTLKPAETLDLKVETRDRPESKSTVYHPPELKYVPGVLLKGVVRNPDGKPAAAAQVALPCDGRFLMIGKGTLTSGGNNTDGLLVYAGADGSFTLPMVEGAKIIVAANDEGIARVSLDQLKSSPVITLEKWGRIEGSLRTSRRPGTNEQVILDLGNMNSIPIHLEYSSYQTRTDDRGRFILTYVPPGTQTVARLVATGTGSWIHQPVDSVAVRPGETVQFNYPANHRNVTGRLMFTDTNALNGYKGATISLRTNFRKYIARVQKYKTQEQRTAFFNSDESKVADMEIRSYYGTLSSDGTFRIEGVPPGKYEVTVDFNTLSYEASSMKLLNFVSAQEFAVPESKNSDTDVPLNLGTVQLDSYSLALEEAQASAK